MKSYSDFVDIVSFGNLNETFKSLSIRPVLGYNEKEGVDMKLWEISRVNEEWTDESDKVSVIFCRRKNTPVSNERVVVVDVADCSKVDRIFPERNIEAYYMKYLEYLDSQENDYDSEGEYDYLNKTYQTRY